MYTLLSRCLVTPFLGPEPLRHQTQVKRALQHQRLHLDPRVAADVYCAIDGFFDACADGREAVAAHEDGGTGRKSHGLGLLGGDVAFDRGADGGEGGGGVEACCETGSEVGVCDEEGVQSIAGAVVVLDVEYWDARAWDV